MIMQCNRRESPIGYDNGINNNFSNISEEPMDVIGKAALDKLNHSNSSDNLNKKLGKKLFKQIMAAHLQLKEVENKLPEYFLERKVRAQRQIYNEVMHDCIQNKTTSMPKEFYNNAFMETKGLEKEFHDSQQRLLDAIHAGLIYLHKSQNQTIRYVDTNEITTSMKVQLMLFRMVSSKMPLLDQNYFALIEEEILWQQIPFSEMYLRVAQRNNNMIPDTQTEKLSNECMEKWGQLRQRLDKIKNLERVSLSHTIGKMFGFEEAFNQMKEYMLKISHTDAVKNVRALTEKLF
jgi:hypothetical protein